MRRLALILVLVAMALASCGGHATSGLVGYQNHVWVVGGAVLTRGQTGDFTGILINQTGGPITLRSARILPLAGYRTPRLIGLAVEPKGSLGVGTGWPPTYPVPMAPFVGYRAPANARIQILWAAAGDDLGIYAARGVQVVVDGRGPVNVISGGILCYSIHPHGPCPPAIFKRIATHPPVS